MSRRDDDLAYGDYHGQGEGQEGDRGLIGDVGRRFFGGKNEVCAFTGQGVCAQFQGRKAFGTWLAPRVLQVSSCIPACFHML